MIQQSEVVEIYIDDELAPDPKVLIFETGEGAECLLLSFQFRVYLYFRSLAHSTVPAAL